MNYSLDIATPEELPAQLRRIADRYREDMSELQSAHGDPNCAKVWGAFATILDRAADSADKAIFKHV